MLQKRLIFVFLSILFVAANLPACAQVVPAGIGRTTTITAGGMGSIFQPDYEGAAITTAFPTTYLCYGLTGVNCIPAAQDSRFPLIGLGAYVDVKYSRWIQIEAEGRWMRFNEYKGISEDNYLIGPRFSIYRLWKAHIYGKALWGEAKMTFPPIFQPGGRLTFTDLAFGGGADFRVTKRFSIRFPDLEYQYWPKWSNSNLKPYGASVGIGYRIF